MTTRAQIQQKLHENAQGLEELSARSFEDFSKHEFVQDATDSIIEAVLASLPAEERLNRKPLGEGDQQLNDYSNGWNHAIREIRTNLGGDLL